MKEKLFYFPRTAYSGTINSEWEKEYDLPENFPDVSRIIRIDSSPKMDSIIIEEENNKLNQGQIKNIVLDGTNVFNVLYHSPEDEKVHFLEFSTPFSTVEPVKNLGENLIPTANVFCTYINCKVISRRKLYIKSKSKINIDIKENFPVSTPDFEDNDGSLFFKTANFSTQYYAEPILKTFMFNEAFTLDGTYPPVENIIFSTVRITPNDLIKGSGYVTLNTTVTFRVLYENENGYTMFIRSIPLSLNVEDSEIDENTLLYYFLSISDQSVSAEMDNYGEERILNFSYSPSLQLFKIKEQKVEVPTDVFSNNYLLENQSVSVIYEELEGIIQKPIVIEKNFEIPDIDFTEIYDTACVFEANNLSDLKDNKTIECVCHISVLGLTENGIKSADFSVNFPINTNEQQLSECYDCLIYPVVASTNISGRNTLYTRISGNAILKFKSTQKYNLLSQYSSIEPREIKAENTFTLYYPSRNESLWDISKEYGIDPSFILKNNPTSFTSDGLYNNKERIIFI